MKAYGLMTEAEYKKHVKDFRDTYLINRERVIPSGVTTMAKEKSNGRQHKATYAKDKHRGGYIIRVIGPNANRFAGRVVPCVRKDDTEDNEKLLDLIWTGKDEETGQPVALYNFEAKPKGESQEEIPF